jgi:redox-sensitive bicupin YhaK (pirin superfamily)
VRPPAELYKLRTPNEGRSTPHVEILQGALGVKTFNLDTLSADEGGEYVLGMKDLHTQACYLVYGRLQAGEGERLIRPGQGHEEILCPVDGPLIVHTNRGAIRLDKSHAVHVKEEDSFFVSNPSDSPVTYVLAGGHCREHH